MQGGDGGRGGFHTLGPPGVWAGRLKGQAEGEGGLGGSGGFNREEMRHGLFRVIKKDLHNLLVIQIFRAGVGMGAGVSICRSGSRGVGADVKVKVKGKGGGKCLYSLPGDCLRGFVPGRPLLHHFQGGSGRGGELRGWG